VSLLEGEHQRVYVFSTYVPVPYVESNVSTPAKLVQDVTAQSIISYDGTYAIPTTIDIDDLSLTPTKTRRLLEITRKFGLLHFGYVAQWETFVEQ
jgi:hypothetical protein